MRVAIVGGGLSGTLTAANLVRRAGDAVRVTLVERRGDFGPGVAYSTTDEQHRLNVPAARMSAFSDDPEHFLRWARRTLGDVDAAAYLPRARYGDYLRDVLAEAGPAVERVAAEVRDVRPCADEDGASLTLDDGRRLRADCVVLAVGALPCAPLGQPEPRIVENPWSPDALAPAPAGTVTAVLGTGLTAVDVVLSATRDPGGGCVVAISRRGRLPRAHLPGLRAASPPPELPEAPATLDELERLVLGHVEAMRGAGYDWRDAFDSLRSHVPALWQLLPAQERRAFLDRRGRDWDVCRHRMAPEVAERIRALRSSGRLRIVCGGLDALAAGPDALHLSAGGAEVRADRLVLCTGGGSEVTAQPLFARLLAAGCASADELRLGLRCAEDGQVLDADGVPQPWLRTLGPPRRGELWETTAAPEIRVQAETLAEALVRVPALA